MAIGFRHLTIECSEETWRRRAFLPIRNRLFELKLLLSSVQSIIGATETCLSTSSDPSPPLARAAASSRENQRGPFQVDRRGTSEPSAKIARVGGQPRK